MPRRKAIRLTRKKFIKWITLGLVIVIAGLFVGELSFSLAIKPIAGKSEDLDTNAIHKLLYYLEYPYKAEEDNIVIDNDYVINAIKPVEAHLRKRYDCSDFMTPTLTRLIYKYEDTLKSISPKGYESIKKMLLDFKYWMTEPGEDSMCFWSENHQILFAAAEYLVGKKWPDEIFTNDGAKGREHMSRAENRINIWMEHRFYYGFSEFNSTNYMQFNIGPMANFIEFGDNPAMVERMKMVMDLALYDLASNMYKFTYMAPAGRAYAYNTIGIEGDRTRKFTDYIWSLNDDGKDIIHSMLQNFISMSEGLDENGNKFYEVPKVILDIGQDEDYRIIKSSSGLDVSELPQKGYVGSSDEQIMMQFGMEAFTNPEVLCNSINYFADNKMFSNKFFKDFRYFNFSIIKKTDLGKFISKKLNPMPNGIALQRANIYTYSTPYYQLANAQDYHPNSYGASQMLNFANLTEDAVAFTAHPARHSSQKNVTATPGYWAGFGRAPSSAQYKNINIIMYKLPKKSGFLELYDVPQFTHTYLPEALYDEVIIDGRYAFAKVNNSYLALTGANKLEYAPFDINSAKALRSKVQDYPNCGFDLIQHGRNQYWIYELSDATVETFSQFMLRIKSNSVSYDGDNLVYESGGSTYRKKYAAEFTVNGTQQNLQYKRFEGAYSNTERESHIIKFSYKGNDLTLNWVNASRIIGNV